MPVLNTHRIHDYTVDKSTGQMRLIGEHHFVALRVGDEPQLYVQDGHVFTSGGPEVPYEDLPDWFWSQYRLVNPKMRGVVGLPLPEEGQPRSQVQPEPKSQPRASQEPEEGITDLVPGYWGCTECGEVVETRKKGVHLAKHGRERKALAKAGQ